MRDKYNLPGLLATEAKFRTNVLKYATITVFLEVVTNFTCRNLQQR